MTWELDDLTPSWDALAAADQHAPLGGAVRQLAAGLLEQLGNDLSPFVVVGHDRRAYAAALLASLAGGAPFVLPHIGTPTALGDLRQAISSHRLLGHPEPPGGWEALALRESTTPLPGVPQLGPEDRLAALFTGGSTGQNRLFWKSPNNVLGEAAAQVAHFGFSARDTILSCVPPNHIYGFLFSVVVPLLCGARVVVSPSSYPADVARTLLDERATVLVAVPAQYRALGAASLREHSLRLALSSAAPLDERDAERFAQLTSLTITEIYGSTETGGIATRHRPSPTAHFVPLDRVDVRSEKERLWVRSPYVSRELLDGTGGFLTGDRVALEPTTSTFELLGRVDGVVKVGGVRVELTEVQRALLNVPGVCDAHVLAREVGGARSQELVALFVGEPDAAAVRRVLGERLSAVAMPRLLLKTPSLPCLANGKLDRQRVLELVTHAERGSEP